MGRRTECRLFHKSNTTSQKLFFRQIPRLHARQTRSGGVGRQASHILMGVRTNIYIFDVARNLLGVKNSCAVGE